MILNKVCFRVVYAYRFPMSMSLSLDFDGVSSLREASWPLHFLPQQLQSRFLCARGEFEMLCKIYFLAPDSSLAWERVSMNR